MSKIKLVSRLLALGLGAFFLSWLWDNNFRIANKLAPHDLPFEQGLIAHFPLRNSLKEVRPNGTKLLSPHPPDYRSFGLYLQGGPEDHLQFIDWDQYFKGQQLTLAFWVKYPKLDTRINQYFNLFWEGDTGDKDRPRLSLWYNPKLAIWHQSLAQRQGYNLPWSWSRRQALVVTLDGPGLLSSLYVNGQQQGQIELEDRGWPSANNLFFAQGFSPATGLPGIYGEITLWNRVLNPKEIEDLYLHQEKRINQFLGLRWALWGIWGLGVLGWVGLAARLAWEWQSQRASKVLRWVQSHLFQPEPGSKP